MSSNIIYPTLTDHINKRPYRLQVPAYYTTLPTLVENGEIAPIFFNRGSPEDMTLTRLPICHMVNMVITKVPFKVLQDVEIIEIMQYIDAYLDEAQNAISRSPELEAFVKKVLILRVEFVRVFKKCLNRHPDWKDAYTGESKGILKMLADLQAICGPYDVSQAVTSGMAPGFHATMTPEQRLARINELNNTVVYNV